MEVTRAPTLFATHFHELTALAQRNDDKHQQVSDIGISNYHVGAHIDPSSRKLTMLYKVSHDVKFLTTFKLPLFNLEKNVSISCKMMPQHIFLLQYFSVCVVG